MVHRVLGSVRVLLPRRHLVRSLAVAALLPMVLALQITGLASTYLGDVALLFTVVAVCVLESAIRWLVVTSATVTGSKDMSLFWFRHAGSRDSRLLLTWCTGAGFSAFKPWMSLTCCSAASRASASLRAVS